MIIGLTGTQGTGKTTILRAAEEAGFFTDKSQLSRTVQKNLGWDSLSRAEETFDNAMALQDQVLYALYDRDVSILKTRQITLVDRTPADVWAYAAHWCNYHGIDIKKNRWATGYKQLCRAAANRYLQFVFIPPIDEIPFVEEPHRAGLDSRNFVHDEIKAFLWDGMLPTHIFSGLTRGARSAEISSVMTKAIVDNQSRYL